MGCGYIALTIEALPAYQSWPTTTLRRSGSEPEPGTGVAYDLGHREGTDAWSVPYVGLATTAMTWTVSGEGTHWFRVRARDGAGHVSDYSTVVSTTVDWTAPIAGPAIISTTSGGSWVTGTTVYYGASGGALTVTVSATETVPELGQAAGLDEITFPDTVSAGDVYTQGGATCPLCGDESTNC